MMMSEITEEQLTEWMALCDAATPEPWCYDSYARVDSIPQLKAYNDWESGGSDDELDEVDDPVCFVPVMSGDTATAQGRKDAEFIAVARTAMPALIAALREARAKVEAWERFFGCESPHDAYAQDTSTWFGREQARANRAENALEAERTKVKRLREALSLVDSARRCASAIVTGEMSQDCWSDDPFQALFEANEAAEKALRVLKETEME